MFWDIRRYEPALEALWNEGNTKSLNGNFLFDRQFMEYHKDRFTDYSLLIFRNARLVVLFPAHQKDDCIFSHEGLSYGGFVWLEKMNLYTTFEMFDFLEKYLAEKGFSKIFYKKMPFFYQNQTANFPNTLEESLFWDKKSPLTRRRLGAVIGLENIKGQEFAKIFQKRRIRQWKKALRNDLILEENHDYSSFWQEILIPTLAKANLKPTHTFAEIELLASRFPQNIRLFVSKKNEEILGGTVIFQNRKIAHAQYIAASETGKKMGALDLLFGNLITSQYLDYQYFSLGTSDDHYGLNWGLWEWKESWGAKAAYYDTYEIILSEKT